MRDARSFPAASQLLEPCVDAVGDFTTRNAPIRCVWTKANVPTGSPGSKYPGDGGLLTHVTIVWQKGQREEWLKFGKPVASRIIDRFQRIESYRAGEIFGLVSWAANSCGTAHSSLFIVRAAGAGEPIIPVPQVDPGGDLLLCVHGWQKVAQVTQLIDIIAASAIDPCDVAPGYWRHIHNRIAVQKKPTDCTHARYHAWLERRKILS